MARKRKIYFKEWAAEWLILVKPTVKGNTFAASYKNPVQNHIIPYFGNKQLTEIRQSDLQEYLNMLAGEYSLDTVKKHKSCLTQMFNEAIDNDLCIKNPARKLKTPKTKESEEKSIYTEEQSALVFKYAYLHRFGAEIQFLIETGVSRSELLALKWKDVDFATRIVYIRNGAAIVPNAATGKLETILGTPKNKYRKRAIPISHILTGILNGLSRQSKYVFCNINGEVHNPRTWARRHFDVFMRDMSEHYFLKGIDIPVVNPHQLRHTRASGLVNGGKNLHATAKYMGWADLKMLQRYVHSDVEDVRQQLGIV